MTGHDHPAPASPASPHVRLLLTAVLTPALVLTALGAWVLWPDDASRPPTIQTVGPGMTYQAVEVTAVISENDGQAQAQARTSAGESIDVHVPPEYIPELAPGDRVRIATFDAGEQVTHVFVDFVRGPPMALLAIVFAVLVVLVARWRGVAALVGLIVSLTWVGVFTLPALLVGRPAVPVALVTAVGIMFVVLYLTHGFSVRTSTALVGTLAGLAVMAAITAWATGAAHLTGLSGEDALDLLYAAPEVRLRSVLACGTILAGLGVLNDVTITQASAVWELRAARPTATWRELYRSGMRIGRDHIASTVYTIAFAYVGAALPLVLLVSLVDRDLFSLLSSGEIAEEVVRTLVGSIGLVLAIPMTTALGAVLARAARPATTHDDRPAPAAAEVEPAVDPA